MLVKNVHHHSKKAHKGRGVSKGIIKSRRQALRALKVKISNMSA